MAQCLPVGVEALACSILALASDFTVLFAPGESSFTASDAFVCEAGSLDEGSPTIWDSVSSGDTEGHKWDFASVEIIGYGEAEPGALRNSPVRPRTGSEHETAESEPIDDLTLSDDLGQKPFLMIAGSLPAASGKGPARAAAGGFRPVVA